METRIRGYGDWVMWIWGYGGLGEESSGNEDFG